VPSHETDAIAEDADLALKTEHKEMQDFVKAETDQIDGALEKQADEMEAEMDKISDDINEVNEDIDRNHEE